MKQSPLGAMQHFAWRLHEGLVPFDLKVIRNQKKASYHHLLHLHSANSEPINVCSVVSLDCCNKSSSFHLHAACDCIRTGILEYHVVRELTMRNVWVWVFSNNIKT